MSEARSFKATWLTVAADRALLPNSVDSYWSWTKLFHKVTGKGASQWTGGDWERFERWMIGEHYSYSARRQARCALNFIFAHVLKMEVGKLNLPVIPKPDSALVVVPTRDELGRIFTNLRGQERLGHADMNTTATHYLQVDLRGAFSPADVPTAQLQRVFSADRREALALP